MWTLQSNEYLLKAALDKIEEAMLGPSRAEFPSQQHLALLGAPLLDLLDKDARIAAPVRGRVLKLLSRLIHTMRQPPPSSCQVEPARLQSLESSLIARLRVSDMPAHMLRLLWDRPSSQDQVPV